MTDEVTTKDIAERIIQQALDTVQREFELPSGDYDFIIEEDAEEVATQLTNLLNRFVYYNR